MVVEIMLLAFVVALLRGGSFRKLSNVELKHLWLVFVMPLIEISLSIARHSGFEKQVYHISEIINFVDIVPWVAFFWLNRRISGSLLVILGLVLNLLPIAANNGMMPISIEGLKAANVKPERIERIANQKMMYHCVLSENTRIKWLADWIPVPAPPFYLHPTVISPGDVFCTLGMFFFVQCAMGVVRRKLKNEVNS